MSVSDQATSLVDDLIYPGPRPPAPLFHEHGPRSCIEMP